MSDSLLVIITVILFSVCCRQLIKTIVTPLPLLAVDRKYAMGALRLERTYKVLAWGIMTIVFLSGLVISFYQVFTQL
ncbi:MAG: hypothetical protein ACLGGX_09045 [Bdellovibrionia bacterium]